MRKLLLWTAVGAVPIALAGLPPAPFDLDVDPARVMPAECLMYAEVPGFPDLCAQGLDHPLVDVVMASPLGAVVREATGGMPLSFALGLANGYVGRPVLPCLEELTRDGLAVGVLEGADGAPVACVVARGDAALWDEVLALAMDKIADAQELPKRRVIPAHRDVRGMDVWLLGDAGAMALEDGVFVAATDEETSRRMLDLGAGPGGLADAATFERPEGGDAFAWVWLDVGGLAAAFPEVTGDPGLRALLGGQLAATLDADAAVLELAFEGEAVDLALTANGAPTTGELPLEVTHTGDELTALLDAQTDALVGEAVARGGDEAEARDVLKQLRRFARSIERAHLETARPGADTLRAVLRLER